MSGTQPVARTSSLSRSCGTNCIRPQLSALSSSACRVWIGVRVPWISEPHLLVAGDRDDLELVVAYDADHGDAEAHQLGDTLGDQLEALAEDGLGPVVDEWLIERAGHASSAIRSVIVEHLPPRVNGKGQRRPPAGE